MAIIQQLFWLIPTLVALALVFIAALVVLGRFRVKGRLERAMNLTLFLIKVPREVVGEGDNKQRNEKEQIAIGEQLLASLTNIHAKGWNKFIFGEPYFALELAVHHVGEEIHFYAAVPRGYAEVFIKQVNAYFPTAEVQPTKDYSIFNPQGVTVGAYLRYENDPVLPIKTYQHLASDPLGGIITALSKLDTEGEGASIQLMLRPSHNKAVKSTGAKVAREMSQGYSFKDALQRANHPPKAKKPDPNNPTPPEPEKPKSMNPADEETVKAIVAKSGQTIFDVSVRLLASAPSQEQADRILQEIEGAFTQYSSPSFNGLKVSKVKDKALERLAKQYAFRLFETGKWLDNANIMPMSTEEINSLYHLPVAGTSAPRVKILKSKPAEPPADLPTSGLLLGYNNYRGQETPIYMTEADRQRHLYIIGQTGTGKSTAMKAMLRQDVEAGKGICLIDPHGEFAEFVLGIVPPERAEDVVYFNPGDIARPMGLNMLEIDPTHPEQKSMVIDELFGIFDKLYDLKTTGGPMFEKYFKNSVLLLLDDYTHEIPTLADISRVLTDDDYRADKLSRETNPLVKEFWQKEAEKAGGDQSLANMAPYISSKVTAFVFNEFLRPIINQPRSAINFREAMDQGKIIVVNLSKGRIGEINANLLGMVIIGKLLMAALSRVDIVDEKARRNFYLYIDEFQNFTTDSIASILSEARKYRLNLIVAHQFIKQLKENIRDAIFGNVGSILSFRIGPDDSEFMKNKFAPVFTPQDIMNIDNMNAYVNMIINGQTARPFNLRIPSELVFGQGDKARAQAIEQLSSLKYGRPREEVEREIMSKYQ